MKLREVNYSRDVTAPAACGCEIPYPHGNANLLGLVTPVVFKEWADGIAMGKCVKCESGNLETTWEAIAEEAEAEEAKLRAKMEEIIPLTLEKAELEAERKENRDPNEADRHDMENCMMNRCWYFSDQLAIEEDQKRREWLDARIAYLNEAIREKQEGPRLY